MHAEALFSSSFRTGETLPAYGVRILVGMELGAGKAIYRVQYRVDSGTARITDDKISSGLKQRV
jgi:hypothetical protein